MKVRAGDLGARVKVGGTVQSLVAGLSGGDEVSLEESERMLLRIVGTDGV